MMKQFLAVITISFLAVFLACEVKAQDKSNPNKMDTKNVKQESNRNLEIKKKPRANSSRLCSQSSGTVKLRVTFDKSEKITDIKIASSSGCSDFDRNAVEAAKKIKFNPELKNGEPITVTKIIEYAFTVY